jgi:hypothetical protein
MMREALLFQLEGEIPDVVRMRLAAYHREHGDAVALHRTGACAQKDCGAYATGRAMPCPGSVIDARACPRSRRSPRALRSGARIAAFHRDAPRAVWRVRTHQPVRLREDSPWRLFSLHVEKLCQTVYAPRDLSMYELVMTRQRDVASGGLGERKEFLLGSDSQPAVGSVLRAEPPVCAFARGRV